MRSASKNLTDQLRAIGNEIEEKATLETILTRLDFIMSAVDEMDQRLMMMENELKLNERRQGESARIKELEYELEKVRYEHESAKAYEAHLMTTRKIEESRSYNDLDK